MRSIAPPVAGMRQMSISLGGKSVREVEVSAVR